MGIRDWRRAALRYDVGAHDYEQAFADAGGAGFAHDDGLGRRNPEFRLDVYFAEVVLAADDRAVDVNVDALADLAAELDDVVALHPGPTVGDLMLPDRLLESLRGAVRR